MDIMYLQTLELNLEFIFKYINEWYYVFTKSTIKFRIYILVFERMNIIYLQNLELKFIKL